MEGAAPVLTDPGRSRPPAGPSRRAHGWDVRPRRASARSGPNRAGRVPHRPSRNFTGPSRAELSRPLAAVRGLSAPTSKGRAAPARGTEHRAAGPGPGPGPAPAPLPPSRGGGAGRAPPPPAPGAAAQGWAGPRRRRSARSAPPPHRRDRRPPRAPGLPAARSPSPAAPRPWLAGRATWTT